MEPELAVVGWREWLSLPELGIARIKAKIDTGARSSALHADDVERFKRGRKTMLRFVVHPLQRNTRKTVHAEAEMIDERHVRSSNGKGEDRPVIVTVARLGELEWPIEVTLTRRDQMGFRMLLGRQALHSRFVVDPGHSYCLGKRGG